MDSKRIILDTNEELTANGLKWVKKRVNDLWYVNFNCHNWRRLFRSFRHIREYPGLNRTRWIRKIDIIRSVRSWLNPRDRRGEEPVEGEGRMWRGEKLSNSLNKRKIFRFRRSFANFLWRNFERCNTRFTLIGTEVNENFWQRFFDFRCITEKVRSLRYRKRDDGEREKLFQVAENWNFNIRRNGKHLFTAETRNTPPPAFEGKVVPRRPERVPIRFVLRRKRRLRRISNNTPNLFDLLLCRDLTPPPRELDAVRKSIWRYLRLREKKNRIGAATQKPRRDSRFRQCRFDETWKEDRRIRLESRTPRFRTWARFRGVSRKIFATDFKRSLREGRVRSDRPEKRRCLKFTFPKKAPV